MGWKLTGKMLEACSCKMMCPCLLGPAEPDQGWCSAALGFDIAQGNSDGVDLGGCKAALALDLPGDFVGGNATGRLYLDSAASNDQRRELEAIFTGKKGGNWEAMSAVITKWLSTQTGEVSVTGSGSPSITVGKIGQVSLQPLKDDAGRPTKVVNAPLAAIFGESEELALSTGSKWSDPDMRAWEAGGSGGITPFSWSA